MKNIFVTDFQSQYASKFYQLNRVWIEESWILEDNDKKDFQKIFHHHIFFEPAIHISGCKTSNPWFT